MQSNCKQGSLRPATPFETGKWNRENGNECPQKPHPWSCFVSTINFNVFLMLVRIHLPLIDEYSKCPRNAKTKGVLIFNTVNV